VLPPTLDPAGAQWNSGSVIRVRIKNIGNKEIPAADFEQPIKIQLARARIVAAAVAGRSEEGISIHRKEYLHTAEHMDEHDELKIVPRGLNPHEWFDIVLLADAIVDGSAVEVESRISGQSRRMARKRHIPSARLPVLLYRAAARGMKANGIFGAVTASLGRRY
jgi:hypothetical protein